MKIIGTIVSPKTIHYRKNPQGWGEGRPMTISQDLTTIKTENGVLTRWNRIPRKYVTSSIEVFRASRRVFVGKTTVKNRIKHRIRMARECALPGETVSFFGCIENGKIVGRIAKKQTK
jgi:hypothetical protein